MTLNVAAWLFRADRAGHLPQHLRPNLRPNLIPREHPLPEVEGWILSVPGLIGADCRSEHEAGESLNGKGSHFS